MNNVIKLNNYVNKVYCINLKHRVDRLNKIKLEFDKLNIEFDRINAIYGETIKNNTYPLSGQLGLIKSWEKILKLSIKNDHNKICIFEDDVILCDDFVDRFNNYVELIPDDWDIMVLGMNNIKDDGFVHVNKFLYKIKTIKGGYAIILNNKNKLFEHLLNIIKTHDDIIDVYLNSLLKNYNGYCYIPFFATIDNFISDIKYIDEGIEYNDINRYFRNDMINYTGASIIKNRNIFIRGSSINIPKTLNILNKNDNISIHVGNTLIYDNTDNNINAIFNDNNFLIGDIKYSYKGIRVKKKIIKNVRDRWNI